MMRNTLPPLPSNELFGGRIYQNGAIAYGCLFLDSASSRRTSCSDPLTRRIRSTVVSRIVAADELVLFSKFETSWGPLLRAGPAWWYKSRLRNKANRLLSPKSNEEDHT